MCACIAGSAALQPCPVLGFFQEYNNFVLINKLEIQKKEGASHMCMLEYIDWPLRVSQL